MLLDDKEMRLYVPIVIHEHHEAAEGVDVVQDIEEHTIMAEG